MSTLVYRPNHPEANQNGFVPKEVAYCYHPNNDKRMLVGNRVVSFYYNSDNMEPLRHMASGKMISSKKKFRDETKAYGCIEVGNEVKIKPRQPVKLDKRQRREDIKKAISELRNGRKV